MLKETVRLRNARVTGCGFCRNVRYAMAREDGLTEDRVAMIDDGYLGSELTDAQKLVLRYTDTFLTCPADLDPELAAAMNAEFSPEEIVEITLAAALFLGMAKPLIALGTEPEQMDPTVIDAALEPLRDWARDMADAGRRMPVTARDGRHDMSYQVHLDLFLTMRSMAPLLNGVLDDADSSELAARMEPLIADIQRSITEAMSGWAYRGGDPELVTAMTLGTYHWLALQSRLGQSPVETSDVARRFMAFIMRALEPQREPLNTAGRSWPLPGRSDS